jgi:hypothetical protein
MGSSACADEAFASGIIEGAEVPGVAAGAALKGATKSSASGSEVPGVAAGAALKGAIHQARISQAQPPSPIKNKKFSFFYIKVRFSYTLESA